jgi:hypothetical protein
MSNEVLNLGNELITIASMWEAFQIPGCEFFDWVFQSRRGVSNFARTP